MRTRPIPWMRGGLFAVVVAALCSTGAAQERASARATRRWTPVGPFDIETKQGGTVKAKLYRRERDNLWVLKDMPSGRTIEAGIVESDIVTIAVPRPRIFSQAEVAESKADVKTVAATLTQFVDLMKPFRDLPGTRVDEAMLLLGRLYERQNEWKAAILCYEDVVNQPYASTSDIEAKLRAGLCYEKLQDYAKAMEYLSAVPIPDDDLDLLSAVYFSKGQAMAGKGNHKEAIIDFLHLVVFYPYVNNNEVRCLEAVLPSFAAIKDWDALYKAFGTLRKLYPNSPETLRAEEFVRQYKEQLDKEKLFLDPVAKEGFDADLDEE